MNDRFEKEPNKSLKTEIRFCKEKQLSGSIMSKRGNSIKIGGGKTKVTVDMGNKKKYKYYTDFIRGVIF